MKREARGLAVPVFLAALTVAFFWKIIFLGRAVGGLDVLEYFYPYRAYAQQAIDNWRLPQWNPDIFGGVPFLANIQAAVFYPLSGLFYFMGEPAAYTWNVAVHAFLGGLFSYLSARQSIRLGRTGALVGAIIFAFGGFLGGQTGHLNQLSAAIWLPALLLCWDKAAAGRLPYVLLGSLVVALQFLAGHTQESYLMLVALGLYMVYQTVIAWREAGFAAVPVNVLVLVVMLALGGALAAVQLIPTIELESWGIRGNAMSYADATNFSLDPRMLLQALLPPFWDRTLLLQPNSSEFLGYVSVTGIVLALAGLIYGRARRYTCFFAFLAALALFLALGKGNPIYPLLFKVVPGLNLFRVPARWLFLYSFAAAMLAGLGADGILATGRKRSWRPLALLLAVAAVVGAGLAHSQLLPPAATLWTWLGFGAAAVAVIFAAIRASGSSTGFRHVGTSFSLAPMAGGAARSSLGFLAAAIVALVGVELWLGAQSLDYNHPTPAKLFSQPIDTIGFLQGQPRPFRVLSIAQDTYAPSAEPAIRQQYGSKLSPEDLLAYLAGYKLREIAEPNTTMAVNVATIDGYDGGLLPLASYVQFKDQLTGIPSAPDDRIRFVIKWLPNRPLLDLAGVRYVVADALSDKSANGVDYDLSSFMQVDQAHPSGTLKLRQPLQTSSVGIVLAVKAGAPLPADAYVGTLTLSDGQGNTRSVILEAGGDPAFGQLPYSERLPTHLSVTKLDQPLEVRSVTLTLGSTNAQVFLNGLALIDDATGASHSPLVAPGLEMTRVFKGDVKIYENPSAMAPAFLVHQGQLPGAAPTYDPSITALVQGDPRPPPSSSLLGRVVARLHRLLPAQAQPFSIPPSWLQAEPNAGGPPDSVKLDSFQPERVDVSTSSDRAGFLVLTQSFYPGWQVTVDGGAQHLLGADGLFQAVYLTAGQHHVEFTFKPRSFTLGAAISLAACAVWLLGLLLAWTGRRARNAAG